MAAALAATSLPDDERLSGRILVPLVTDLPALAIHGRPATLRCLPHQ